MSHDFLQPINTVFDVLTEELEPDILERVLRSIASRIDQEAEERREQERSQREWDSGPRPPLVLRELDPEDEELQEALRASAAYARLLRDEDRDEDEWLLAELANLDLGDD